MSTHLSCTLNLNWLWSSLLFPLQFFFFWGGGRQLWLLGVSGLGRVVRYLKLTFKLATEIVFVVVVVVVVVVVAVVVFTH